MAATGELKAKKQNAHNDTINAVDFSPDNRMIVSVSDDNYVKLWDAGVCRRRPSLEIHTRNADQPCASGSDPGASGGEK